MFSLRFSRLSLVLMIGLTGLISIPASSQTVIITGQAPSCTGDCGGTLIGGIDSSSGGGGMGSSGTYTTMQNADGYNDGTKGKGNDFNRQPGCLREGLFMSEALSYAKAGNPPGSIIMTSFGDPRYQGSGWVKYEFGRFYSEWRTGMPVALEFRTVIHFMYNINTGVVDQMKLKTAFQYGCQGFAKN